MGTKDCHQCKVLTERTCGCLGRQSPSTWDCFPSAFHQSMLLPACAPLQGRARFNNTYASNQNLISSVASRRCLLKTVTVAGYQVLIPPSHASISTNHRQCYPYFLTFTRKPVCSLQEKRAVE